MRATPHGHCHVCGDLVPPEHQDAGELYCSSTCRYVATGEGRQTGICITCGEIISWHRWTAREPTTCSDHCSRLLGKLRSRLKFRSGATRPRKAKGPPSPTKKQMVCDVCGKPWCRSFQCERKRRKTCRKEHFKRLSSVLFDDYTPTEEEFSTMYDNCVAMGIFNEADQVLSQASNLRGVGDTFQGLKTRLEGDEERHIACLGLEARFAKHQAHARHDHDEDDDETEMEDLLELSDVKDDEPETAEEN